MVSTREEVFEVHLEEPPRFTQVQDPEKTLYLHSIGSKVDIKGVSQEGGEVPEGEDTVKVGVHKFEGLPQGESLVQDPVEDTPDHALLPIKGVLDAHALHV